MTEGQVGRIGKNATSDKVEVKATVHQPVMLAEVLTQLTPQPGQILVDGTAGGGGHLAALADCVAPAGWVLGIDRDPSVIQRLEATLAGRCVQLACGSFVEIGACLQATGVKAVDGVLLDLGLSSDQLADPERGFSFNIDGPLDLRFNPHHGEPAWRFIQRLGVDHLANVIYEFGEEKQSRRIARAIVAARRDGPVDSAAQLADIVCRAVPRRRHDRIHPATRTFQALRIAVNQELEHLARVLAKLPQYVQPGARVAVISFHSLED